MNIPNIPNETQIIDHIAAAGPWLAPIPTAYMVYQGAINHLRWNPVIALAGALVIEVLGLAGITTALTLWNYNQSKRKTDPTAPQILAFALVAVYLVAALLLVMMMDIYPPLVMYAPAVFPLLSVAGAVLLALRSDHTRRLTTIREDRAERRAARMGTGTVTPEPDPNPTRTKTPNTERPNAARSAQRVAAVEQFLTYLIANPQTDIKTAAAQVGRSKSWGSETVTYLESAGRLRRNGNGWEQ